MEQALPRLKFHLSLCVIIFGLYAFGGSYLELFLKLIGVIPWKTGAFFGDFSFIAVILTTICLGLWMGLFVVLARFLGPRMLEGLARLASDETEPSAKQRELVALFGAFFLVSLAIVAGQLPLAVPKFGEIYLECMQPIWGPLLKIPYLASHNEAGLIILKLLMVVSFLPALPFFHWMLSHWEPRVRVAIFLSWAVLSRLLGFLFQLFVAKLSSASADLALFPSSVPSVLFPSSGPSVQVAGLILAAAILLLRSTRLASDSRA